MRTMTGRQGKEREPPGAKGGAMTGEELDITPTKFVFFKAFHDESTVGVVSSLVAGIMGDGAECRMRLPRFARDDGLPRPDAAGRDSQRRIATPSVDGSPLRQ